MFLDDKLYQYFKANEVRFNDNPSEVVKGLYKICDDTMHGQVSQSSSYKEVRVILDRIFRSWDLFVNRLENEKNDAHFILFITSYKDAFMSVEKMKAIYDRGI